MEEQPDHKKAEQENQGIAPKAEPPAGIPFRGAKFRSEKHTTNLREVSGFRLQVSSGFALLRFANKWSHLKLDI